MLGEGTRRLESRLPPSHVVAESCFGHCLAPQPHYSAVEFIGLWEPFFRRRLSWWFSLSGTWARNRMTSSQPGSLKK
jgi:hypothetical protein